MNKEKFLISLPYLYPVCPISIDHARMFVVADINARWERKKGKQVCFPIAAHFSGVTAEKTCELLNGKYEKDSELYKERKKMLNIFSNIYKVPDNIIELLKTPQDILYYFTYQIINDLKNINVSCDFDLFYTTNCKDFEKFVKVMFEFYETNNALIMNEKNELALNYSDKNWKEQTLKSFNNIEFLQSFHKNNVMGSFDNIRKDFGLLRDYGIGIKYNEKYVIDPMFDSDLFTLYDLYMKVKGDNDSEAENVFKTLFNSIKNTPDRTHNEIVNKIIEWLPCDLFVCEEHLKTWIIKKTYSETLLLRPELRTKKYFITGMGKINNERMSSSRGTAILLKDLIEKHGVHNARLIILMTGGHPSKLYNYDLNLPNEIMKMTNYFMEYVNYLYSKYLQNTKVDATNELIKERKEITNYIEQGYYKQAIILMMKIIPKNNRIIDSAKAKEILEIYNEFLDIIVPNLLNVKL